MGRARGRLGPRSGRLHSWEAARRRHPDAQAAGRSRRDSRAYDSLSDAGILQEGQHARRAQAAGADFYIRPARLGMEAAAKIPKIQEAERRANALVLDEETPGAGHFTMKV